MNSSRLGSFPYVTVVIATAGRPQLLRSALAALATQDVGTAAFEVVVSVDGPDPSTVQVLEEAAAGSLRLRWVQQSRRSGPAAARNAALELASGEIVAITDDDCVPSPHWLAGLAEVFNEHSEVGVVIGKTVTNRDCLTPFSHYVENTDGKTHQTCNIGYRRTVIEALKGFDERFPYSHEDTDLFLRAERITQTRFAPGALVLHPPRELSVREFVRSARRFEGDFIFAEKHPRLYRKRHDGKGPLAAVFWDVVLKHSGKQLVVNAPWLVQSPVTYLRFAGAQLLYSASLLLQLPRYWRRYCWRGLAPTAPRSVAGPPLNGGRGE